MFVVVFVLFFFVLLLLTFHTSCHLDLSFCLFFIPVNFDPLLVSDIIKMLVVLFQVLPLPKDVVTHLDYSSKLRLSLCFFRLKTLTGTVKSEVDEEKEELNPVAPAQCSSELTTYKKKSPLFNLGMLQDLMTEVGG